MDAVKKAETTLDMRDGFVYFGCKKSIKQHQQNLDNESTTIVSYMTVRPDSFSSILVVIFATWHLFLHIIR